MEYKKYGRKIVDAIEGIDNPAYKVSLDCIRRSHFTLGTLVIANTIYDGFITLCQSKNYLCAIQQIRMQIDNCMTVFASQLVKNQTSFYNHFDKGGALNQLKVKGNALTTNYLLELLDEKYLGIRDIYREGCKWIHPTSKRLNFYYITPLTNGEPTSIVGYKDKEYSIVNGLMADTLLEDICNDMYYAMDILLELVNEQIRLQREEASAITTDEQLMNNIDEVFDKIGIQVVIPDSDKGNGVIF